VHLGARGEVVVFAVLTEQQVERARVLQRASHHARVHQTVAIVADPDRAGLAQVGHLGELLTS
jgi:hypothetical protein